MAEMHTDNSRSGADFDLTQFYQIFFEEAGENLDQMEKLLLELDMASTDDEHLNGIFRCAHSIKGGAATFGFADVADLTHQMESLLDRLRRHALQLSPAMVDALLESVDASRSLLARQQAGGEGAVFNTSALVRRIHLLASGAPTVAAPTLAAAWVVVAAPVAFAVPKTPGLRTLVVQIGPLAKPEHADAVKELFRDIPGLGTVTTLPSESADTRVFGVKTTSTDDDLLALFTFHVSRDVVRIRDLDAEALPAAELPATETVVAVAAPGVSAEEECGLVARSPGHPANPSTAAPAAVAKVAGQASLEATTIRVDIKKVDQLIALVGELVITQAMLAQNSQGLEPALHQQLIAGLADLDRNTRDLQESVLSIRMVPMSIVFSRFPRMLRDLANRLGKKVDFVTQGGSTELDKGLVEKITDPLTHLLRNSCDHGIEMPADRIAAGKPENGSITISAVHQGGSIVIEVRDDGNGLSRERILRKARERGLDVGAAMTDADVWQLIFAPGFSTADVVTDVSGRGVGMDVVKRNIASLNGTVDIESVEGQGMKVSVRLPLTLALMDGMSVRVGHDGYILPLSSAGKSVSTVA